MLDTLKTLCILSGASGCEDEVRDYILERVMPHVDSVTTDAMGNLIVTKKGKVTPNRKILLAAHMDEVGIIITNIDENGFLHFAFIGGVDRRVVIGKRVYIGKDGVRGVIGIKPVHLLEKGEEKTVPKLDNMYIDIGAQSKEEAEKRVFLGDEGVFEDSVLEFGDGFLKAKAIDDRVGCAAMIKLIESDLPCDCTFAFTVQEEVGTRGAQIVSARVNPDVAIVLEGTTAADLPGVDEGKRICKLGKVWFCRLWTGARSIRPLSGSSRPKPPAKTISSGRPRPASRAARTRAPSSAAGPDVRWSPFPRPSATSTPPQALQRSRILRTCQSSLWRCFAPSRRNKERQWEFTTFHQK